MAVRSSSRSRVHIELAVSASMGEWTADEIAAAEHIQQLASGP